MTASWILQERFVDVTDPNTLAELWDAHADRLLLIARSIGGPAEDAVQEAFVALATQHTLPRDPMGWLVRVTRNRLLQWQRANRRRRNRETVVGELPWFDCNVLSVDQELDAREVTSALLSLASSDREVIVMHLWARCRSSRSRRCWEALELQHIDRSGGGWQR